MKPILLLIPGVLNTQDLWRFQISALQDRYELIIPEIYHIPHISSIARVILQDVPGQFSLAGFSMGGYVALEIIRQQPHRVQRLALLNTSARPDTDLESRRRRCLIHQIGQGTFPGITRRMMSKLVHSDNLDNTDLSACLNRMALKIGPGGYITQQKAIISRRDQRPILSGLDVKTLVIAGQQDQYTPPDLSIEIANLVPYADLRIVDRCGHLTPLEYPDKITNFLSEWFSL